MKKYYTLPLILAALLVGVVGGVGASFLMSAMRSLLFGGACALLALFAIPSHFYAKDRVFHAKAKELGELALNAPVTILTQKKTYPARICATKDKITLLFCFKGKIVPLVLHRADGISLTVSEDGYVSLLSKNPERGVFFTSGAVLHNITEVVEALKKLNY